MAKGNESADNDSNVSDSQEDGVFTKFIKTVTYQNGYTNDGKDPGFKALNTASFDDATAMAGLQPGTKQEKITGDSVYHFLGNYVRIVDEEDRLLVTGKQNETVKGDTRHLYKGNFLRGVSKNDDVRVNMHRNIIVLGESKENYAKQHEVTAPDEFEWKTFERGFSLSKLDMMAVGFDLHKTEIQVHDVDLEIGVVKCEPIEIFDSFAEQHAVVSALKSKIAASIDAELHGNTLISLGLDLPF